MSLYFPLLVSLRTNGASIPPQESWNVALRIHNTGYPGAVDMFFGLLLPDGTTALLVTSSGIATGSLADLTTLSPWLGGVSLKAPFAAATDFFPFLRFHGGEPSGLYTLFLLVTKKDALADGALQPGELLARSLASTRR